MLHKWILSPVLLGSLLTFSLIASDKQDAATDCENNTYRPYRITARHIEGGGVGYNQGYTSLEGFFTPFRPIDDEWIPFLDLRAHIFDNGRPAANAGIGIRHLGSSRIWGGSAYYDYRKTGHQHYNQVSFGFETLGKIWDIRGNCYIPVGKNTSPFFSQPQFDSFKGHYMLLSRKREFAFAGANAEVGAHAIAQKNLALYAALGPYYLTGQGETAWGGEARASLDFFNYVKLEGNTSYDHVFKWIGQVQLGISVPFGGKRVIKTKKNRSCAQAQNLSARAMQHVDRSEIIPVDRQRILTPAIDPTTGSPYIFYFVDNTSHSAGTFESPFSTLAAAAAASSPYNIIYVFPGDGTSTGMNQGITLKNNQKLLGSGINQTLATTFGTMTIPSQSSGIPLITNTTSNVITPANNNEIAGLYITVPSNSGIGCFSINNISIHNNNIVGSTGFGLVAFANFTGTATIENNYFLSTPGCNTILEYDDIPTSATYTITHNQFETTVTASHYPNTLYFYGPRTGGNFNITYNQFSDLVITQGHSFSYSTNITIENNTVTRSPLNTFVGVASGNLRARVNNNTWTNSSSDYSITVTNYGTTCLTMANNISDRPAGSAYSLNNQSTTSSFVLEASGNTPTPSITANPITLGTCP